MKIHPSAFSLSPWAAPPRPGRIFFDFFERNFLSLSKRPWGRRMAFEQTGWLPVKTKQPRPAQPRGGMTGMIKVENLSKDFGPKTAVNHVSFTVERGEVLGFLGPNGAGKSTTMRMITGFIPPSEGRVSVGGFDMAQDPIPAKRLIGYLPENAPAYTDMTVEGFLGFMAELRGLHGEEKKKAIQRVVEMCFLESVLLPERGHPFQRLPPSHLFRPIHPARPRRAGARRADRRPGPESEARGPQP